jgi:hypothetical protein
MMKNYLNAIIFAVTIVITALILTGAYKNRFNYNNIISVTGLGSKDFVSDLIVWSGSFTKKNMDLQTAYVELNKDRNTIRQHLLSKGILSDEIVFTSVNIIKDYDYIYDRDGNRKSRFTGYKLTQRVQIESGEVDKIESVSREVTELINYGVEFYSQNPEYYYTKLAELKIEMIAEATKDARLRAEKIAENSGAKLGELQNAKMGIFQIIAQNSSEEYSWGGTFNTSSKRKTATITMKLTFGIR